MKNLVIIGASFSGLNLAKILHKDFKIKIISLDKYPYKKNLLLEFLKGNLKSKDLLFEKEYFELDGVDFILGRKVIKINPVRKDVFLEDKKYIKFDYLVIASGSSPQYISCPGIHKRGVASIYTLEDVKYIKDMYDICSHPVVFLRTCLGVSLLNWCIEKEKEFKVIVSSSYLSLLGEELSKNLESSGKLIVSGIKEIIGNGDVKAVRLESDKIIACDLLIVDTGLKPNLSCLRNSGIEYEDYLKVDDYFRTNFEYIFGIGDVINKNLINLTNFSNCMQNITPQIQQLSSYLSKST